MVPTSTLIPLPEIQKNFGFPLEEAAKNIGIGSTALKKTCRQYGISRWPYRKIKCLTKRISQKETAIKQQPGRFRHNLRELSVLIAEKHILEECLPPEKAQGIAKDYFDRGIQERVWHSCGDKQTTYTSFSLDYSPSPTYNNDIQVVSPPKPTVQLPISKPKQRKTLPSFSMTPDVYKTNTTHIPIPSWFFEDREKYIPKTTRDQI